jgi:hypothetical protein
MSDDGVGARFGCYGSAQPGDNHLLARIVAVDAGIYQWIAAYELRKQRRNAWLAVGYSDLGCSLMWATAMVHTSNRHRRRVSS